MHLRLEHKGSRESLTKEEWNSLGFNENNADFVKVEELEE